MLLGKAIKQLLIMAKSKPELLDLIDWLKRDPMNRFEIYNLDTGKSLKKCASYDELSEGTITPMGYFENLADQGIENVQVLKKRKCGNAFVRVEGFGLNYALTTQENNVAASGRPDSPVATPQQFSKPSYAGSGLGSPTMGLGFPEIMEMRSNADRYQEAKAENDKLKAKVELLSEKNQELEKANLRHEIGADSKPSALDKFFEAIAANPAMIPQIAQSFKGGSGLNAPQPQLQQPNLSDVKSMVVDLIANNKQLDDDHVTAAYYILAEALKGNNKFINDYLKLLQDYKLIENGSNNTNNSSN